MKGKMRIEMMIALVLFGINTTIGHVFNAPEFLRGFLFGLSIALMVIGILPEKTYNTFGLFSKEKRRRIKEVFGRAK